MITTCFLSHSLRSAGAALLLLMILATAADAQRQYETWYFGSNAGISFEGGTATPLLDGQVNTVDGSAVISRATTGDLLFYSDGRTVWDSTHAPMPNGNGLAGHQSSGQPALIVPLPGDTNRFYLFTTGAANTASTATQFSTVNMQLNGGRGDVVLKNQLLLAQGTEKITATRHCNGVDYWIIAHTWGSNRFYAYLLTANGIVDTVTSEAGIIYLTSAEVQGTFQVSPSGKLLGVSSPALKTIEVFDFDNGSGVISNQRILAQSDVAYYGLEFSPDNSKIYVNTLPNANAAAHLYQFDLAAGNINAIQASRYQYVELRERDWQGGQLQLGGDGKIYVAWDRRDSLGTISNPNAVGPAAQYNHNGFWLGGRGSRYGLPNVIDSDIDTTNRAEGSLSTSVRFRPSTAKPGETVSVVVVICNGGNQPVNNVGLDLQIETGLVPLSGSGSGPYTFGSLAGNSCDSFEIEMRVPNSAQANTSYDACLEFRDSAPLPCAVPQRVCDALQITALPIDTSEVDYTFHVPTACPGTTSLVNVLFHSRRFTDTIVDVRFQGDNASLFSWGGAVPIRFAIKPTSDQYLPILVRRSDEGRQSAVMILATTTRDTFRVRLVSDVKSSTTPFIDLSEIRTGGRSTPFDTCIVVTNTADRAVAIYDTAWVHGGAGASLLSPSLPFLLIPGKSREICFRISSPGAAQVDTLILGGSEPVEECPHCFHQMVVINGLNPEPLSSVHAPGQLRRTEVQIVPNPASDQFVATTSLDTPGPVSVEVIDLTGRIRLTLRVDRAESGEHLIPFDSSDMPAGIYLLRVTTSETESIATIQIIR